MSADYDVITVGGGLGGSALAKVLAEHGARVLVVKRERQFSDRIHGEWIAPWGVAEAQRIGFTTRCSNDARMKPRMWNSSILDQSAILRPPPRNTCRP
jgi:choline dehydrogenase-like flavoprotein